MNRRSVLVIALVASTVPAFADPPPPPASPWGSSPYVVAYAPPPDVDTSHRGLTLEIALGGGTTSVDASTGAGTLAIGGWLTHDLALALRVSAVGSYGFVGGSLQLYANGSLWFGAGFGSMTERGMDELGNATSTSGAGGFARAGYNLGHTGPHALYISGELQAAAIGDQTRTAGLVALGYQLL